MRRPSKWLWVLLLSTGCFNLDLPSAPGVGAPGIVSGRLVWQRPGRLQAEAARGASVFVLGTNLAVSSDADGRFLIEGLISSEGTLFIRFDGDGDGRPERQRTFLLQQIGAGRGRQIALGDITLGQSAAISGRVVLADVADPNGYLGTPAFVPGFPLAAITQADGTFLLEGLSEGSVQLAAVRSGYQASLSGPLTLRGGEELSLALISLRREVQPVSGVLRGRVVNADGEPLPGVTVTTGTGLTTTTEGQGIWRFSGLPVDRYDVIFSAPGRLPAALYNVLLAGPDEAVTPDVVLSEGQSTGTTPSLVQDITMERDAGADAGSDAGTIIPRDAGSDAGFDGGFDGGFDAGTDAGSDAGINYQVSIGYGPPGPIVLFPGATLGLSAIIMPPAATPFFAWSVMPAGVVMLGDLSAGNTGMTAIAQGSFRVDLTVTIGTQTFIAPFISGQVVAPDAGVDAGVDAGIAQLMITGEGVSALSYWMQTEGPFAMGPISGTVLAGSTPVPSTFLYNGVTQRLVAVFDEPQPSRTITISYPNLVLIDGGVREVAARSQPTPALQFSPATLLKDGGADFNAGATYTPHGLIVVGRFFDGPGCAGCFLATSDRGQDALMTADSTPPVPWRRAAAAGFTVHAWYSETQSYKRNPIGTNWMPGPLPAGPVFADGPVLRSVGVSGQSIQLSDYNDGGWMQSDGFGEFDAGVSFRRSTVVRRPGGDLHALVIDDVGKFEVWSKPDGGWAPMTATLPPLSGVQGGRIADTKAGPVMFVITSSGNSLLWLKTGELAWQRTAFSTTPLDLVGRGSRAYLVSTGTGGLLEVRVIDPASGSVDLVSVPLSTSVNSAELAVGDFGELGLAWSTGSAGQFQLLSAEIK